MKRELEFYFVLFKLPLTAYSSRKERMSLRSPSALMPLGQIYSDMLVPLTLLVDLQYLPLFKRILP